MKYWQNVRWHVEGFGDAADMTIHLLFPGVLLSILAILFGISQVRELTSLWWIFVPLYMLAFFTVWMGMCYRAATHFVDPTLVLFLWPLLALVALDAIINPNGYTVYLRRGLIWHSDTYPTVDARKKNYNDVIVGSIFLCCVAEIPEIIIRGVSTTSRAMTADKKVLVLGSLVFNIYCLAVNGLRKYFIAANIIGAGTIADFQEK